MAVDVYHLLRHKIPHDIAASQSSRDFDRIHIARLEISLEIGLEQAQLAIANTPFNFADVVDISSDPGS